MGPHLYRQVDSAWRPVLKPLREVRQSEEREAQTSGEIRARRQLGGRAHSRQPHPSRREGAARMSELSEQLRKDIKKDADPPGYWLSMAMQLLEEHARLEARLEAAERV